MHHEAGSVVRPRSFAVAPIAIFLGLAAVGHASADKVELANGDVLTGKVVERTDTTVVFESETLGRLEIARDQIASITIEPDAEKAAAEGEPMEEAPEEPAKEEEEKPAEEKKEKDWTLAVDLSLSTASGNTNEVAGRFGLNFNRQTASTRLRYDLSWYIKASLGAVTDNKATTGIRHDWLLPESRWFMFIAGRADYDQFESWEQRVNAQGGPGYHLIQKEDFDAVDMELDVIGGLGVRKEFGSINDEAKLEAVLGLEYTWYITGRMSLVLSFNYFPVVTDFSDYRTRSTGEWRYVFEENMNLSLVIGFSWETQSVVDPGKEPFDFRTYIGIQYAY